MSSSHPLSQVICYQEHATVGCKIQVVIIQAFSPFANMYPFPTALLSDICGADLPIHHTDTLVAAIHLHACSLLWELSGMIPNPGKDIYLHIISHVLTSMLLLAQHPVVLPSNLDVNVPSNHELCQ